MTGRRAPAGEDLAGAMWDYWLAGTGISPAEMVVSVHALDPDSHARKLEAVRAYRTQLLGLQELAGNPADRETLGYEVVWALPSAATRSPAPADCPAAPH